MYPKIPFEVSNHIAWFLSGRKPVAFSFFLKDTTPRDRAWRQVEARPETSQHEKNPWRKCHTENFWVWVIPPKEPSEVESDHGNET
jgi:hypothetical protein